MGRAHDWMGQAKQSPPYFVAGGGRAWLAVSNLDEQDNRETFAPFIPHSRKKESHST